MKQYRKIIKYKTSYYSFYLPVACAMVLVSYFDHESEFIIECVFIIVKVHVYCNEIRQKRLTRKIGKLWKN
jgi:hypothetical protein